MFLIEDRLHWSASDLTTAAECEYGLLRRLDYKLGRAQAITAPHDPLREHIARLGDRHETQLLVELQATRDVTVLDHIEGKYTQQAVEAAHDATVAAFAAGPDMVFQAAFFDGEFFGYADFVERAEDGWRVCDAKLARRAKPQALLQLGAYAEQIRTMGLPLSSTVSLLLGNGERVDFPVADVLPAFLERRKRFRALVAGHRTAGTPVAWGVGAIVECGSCVECRRAAAESNDLVLVAGLRMDQRRKLRAIGIATVADLASADAWPKGMAPQTFEKLQAQASLQWSQMQSGDAAGVEYELIPAAPTTLALLPAPSDGDLFFDFEGDPLYNEGDFSRTGLEYLWGVMGSDEVYFSLWAHSSAEERDAFVQFMDLVAERRAKYPDLHIYHYAPYETAALKRLAMRYQTREKELDDLLRSEVFVDLYATVRGAVRVSAPSYSIKKLEPLYMGSQLRSDEEGAVADGGASVVAYHEYRAMCGTEPEAAIERLRALEDYNEYDCLSTLRLRDWLLELAEEAGVRDLIVPRVKDVQGEELSENDPVFVELMAKSGPVQRSQRSPEEQAFAMLATAIDYYRRERKQFWWEHFERLQHPIDDCAETRDVFLVESAKVIQDWIVPGGKAKNARRVLRLAGDWGAGSKPASGAQVVYPSPCPPRVSSADGAPYGAGPSDSVVPDSTDPRVVLLTESRQPDSTFSDLPVALVPSMPPGTKEIEAAIKEVASASAVSAVLPHGPALDILARRPPRMRDGAPLPSSGSTIDDVVAALTGMDDSYVAVQGPPGTGKSYTASRVIKQLVENYHWRIGVVAQSHAVVENLLAGIVRAGLDPALVGKDRNESDVPTWTVLKEGVPSRAKFLTEHATTGCVLGGTAWTFANPNMVERRGLDLVVIEEAGQFSLAPTLGVSVAAKRLLLLGDPQQLPQVSQGVHAEPVDESALGWILDGQDTIASEFGYFLAESYRMHPALCSKVSVLSYEGRLGAAPEASGRALGDVAPGLGVVLLDHTGRRTESPEEAAEVVAQVRAHLGLSWTDPQDATTPRSLDECDFLVVAPYNAQVALIRRQLDDAGLHDVRVGTVDRFQGKEAPVALVSMTASSHGDVPRGMGFLLNRNRVNVAVSRAKWKAIVVRSSALTTYMPSSADGVLELGAFIGLCVPEL